MEGRIHPHLLKYQLLHILQGLEWRISEKDNEIAATHQRLKLIEDRQATELASLSQTLQVIY